MKLNLKTVTRAFASGLRVGSRGVFAVSSLSLHVLDDIKYVRVGTIDRDDYLDLTAKQLKHKITKMREQADGINHNRKEWMVETHFHGNVLDSQQRSAL